MKPGKLVAVAGAAAFTSVAAVSFPRAVQGKGYLSVPVNEVKRDLSGLSKRDAFEVLLKNRDFYYSMDIQIGNPGQKVTVLLDTGSSELWVNPDCSTAPSASQAKQCAASGQYNPRDSRTPPIGPFGSRKLNYGDASAPNTQTSAEIAYYSDTIAMGSGIVLNQTFGVVTKSDGIANGILGLAPDLRAGWEPNKPYSLIINSLAEQNVINSRVFSLDLRHSNSETGALIFGGIDKGKYIGKLESRPIVNGMRNEPRLAVEVASIGMSLPNSQPKTYPLAADDKSFMLDSGTTLTRMHASLAKPILADLKATVNGDSGYWVADCALRTPPLTNGGGDNYLTFQFGKKTIRVPFSDFILDLGPSAGLCYVGLVITTDQQILGDSVLRAGYFVFDWDNKAVHIAQAANCGKEDIVAVGKGANAVPTSAVGLCDGDSGDSNSDGDSGNSGVSQPVPASTSASASVSAPASLSSSVTSTTVLVMNPATTDNWATTPLPFSISFTRPELVTITPSTTSSSSASATYQTVTVTLTPSSQTPSSTQGSGSHGSASSTSNSSHSAAFAWATESRSLGLLAGSLMTTVAVLWNV
ncbi:secreted aspartic proteinase [Colletotrichum musicola]|uniref:Secreted aspartic proteinase n=1 Tax=Colletotrichum musicola TaxID=2175873 RepID=A0A8H6NXL3_9PEZI|nr:secreted aspartic proteinase [Colletotrichum musicola]